ncbi:MAG TPA: NGG1p interacting factor NIF3 [bacterium]|nr:NGG1p interacting factor NIF3 [bacterium]
MKLKDIYQTVIQEGIKVDPRGKDGVAAELKRIKEVYTDMPAWKKELFDEMNLTNPFADTRILNGPPDGDIKRIMVGIDIEVAELLLADRLSEKGKKIDMALSHHPEGTGLAGLHQVMYMQADVLNRCGVPINVAEGILAERIKEVERRVLPANHMRAVDAAKLLGITFMCAHTPCDNHVADYLQRMFDKGKPQLVKDVVRMLEEIPEYRDSVKNDVPPKIVSGHDKRRCGRVLVDMTGGTEGSKMVFEKLATTEVGTVVGMHFSEDHVKEAAKSHINLVVAGHIASDNLGVNLVLDKICRKDPKIEIVACSGFVRHSRN